MTKELELLDIEIAKAQTEINDTSIGISLLGTFFLGLIPVFYGIMGIYDLHFHDIHLPMITAVAIVFFATILSVLHWEQNTQKLKKLYAKKIETIQILNQRIETEKAESKKNKKR